MQRDGESGLWPQDPRGASSLSAEEARCERTIWVILPTNDSLLQASERSRDLSSCNVPWFLLNSRTASEQKLNLLEVRPSASVPLTAKGYAASPTDSRAATAFPGARDWNISEDPRNSLLPSPYGLASRRSISSRLLPCGELQYRDSLRTSRGQVSRVAEPARRNSHEDSRREVSSTVFGISGALCGSSGFLMRARFVWDPSFVWNRGPLLAVQFLGPPLSCAQRGARRAALPAKTSRRGHRARDIGEAVRRPPPNQGVESLPGDPPDRIQAGHEVRRSRASPTRDIQQLTSSMTVVLAVAYARGPGSPASARDGSAGDEVNQEAMECLPVDGIPWDTHRLRDQGAFGPRTQRTNTGDPVSWRP